MKLTFFSREISKRFFMLKKAFAGRISMLMKSVKERKLFSYPWINISLIFFSLKEILFHDKNINSIFLHNFWKVMPKGDIFKKECKKVLLNSYVIMQFSLFDQLFFPVKKGKYWWIFLGPRYFNKLPNLN